jgi:hypothetical protein
VFGDEYFNCIVTITKNEHDFVTASVVSQNFKTRHIVRIRAVEVVYA